SGAPRAAVRTAAAASPGRKVTAGVSVSFPSPGSPSIPKSRVIPQLSPLAAAKARSGPKQRGGLGQKQTRRDFLERKCDGNVEEKRKINAWSTAEHDVPCADQPSYAQLHVRHGSADQPSSRQCGQLGCRR